MEGGLLGSGGAHVGFFLSGSRVSMGLLLWICSSLMSPKMKSRIIISIYRYSFFFFVQVPRTHKGSWRLGFAHDVVMPSCLGGFQAEGSAGAVLAPILSSFSGKFPKGKAA